MGIKFSQLPIASSVASDDYLAVLDTSESVLKRTAVSHASTTDAFGLGTASAYGHNKIIDDLSKTSFANGEVLSAHQGNILANDLGYVESNNTAGHAHSIGEYFMFKGQFVKCTAAISVGNTITLGTNVAATDVGSVLSQLNSNIAPSYSAQKTYAVGDLVTYSGKLYKCIAAIGTPEAFNINKWDDVTASEVFARKTKILSHVISDGTKTRAQVFNELMSNVGSIPIESELALVEIGTTGNKYISHQTNQFADGRLTFVISTAYLDGNNHVVATNSYRTLSSDLTKCRDFYTEFNNGTYSEGIDSSTVVSANAEYYLIESDFS